VPLDVQELDRLRSEPAPWSTPTVEEVPWDALPTEVRMLDSKQDAGSPPQGIAAPEAPSTPPAMTYDEEIAEIMNRPNMLPGDRKRALNAAQNRENVKRLDAQMRSKLH
jgi:hypothetical protein